MNADPATRADKTRAAILAACALFALAVVIVAAVGAWTA